MQKHNWLGKYMVCADEKKSVWFLALACTRVHLYVSVCGYICVIWQNDNEEVINKNSNKTTKQMHDIIIYYYIIIKLL